MTSPISLSAAILLSVIIMYLSFHRLGKLQLSKSRRKTLTYLTLFIPLLGYYFVKNYKQG